jgi:hypothetical protein
MIPSQYTSICSYNRLERFEAVLAVSSCAEHDFSLAGSKRSHPFCRLRHAPTLTRIQSDVGRQAKRANGRQDCQSVRSSNRRFAKIILTVKTMKLSQPIIFLSIVVVIISGAGFWLFQNGYFHRASTTFEPPYPEVNTNGDPILAVFEGRIPCAVTNCEKLKVGLVLYQNREARSPTTYWLGIVGTSGNDRIVTQGTWTTRHGVKEYPDAVVYELDSNTSLDLRFYWRVNEDILLPLDQNMSPKVGNAGWGYMLSRYAEPYGPRTYK